MQVRQIAALAAECLGRDDLAESARSATDSAHGETASLLRCYNLVENEIALDYIPLIEEERLAVQNGGVSFSRLRFAPVELRRVSDDEGSKIAFSLFPDRIAVKPSVLFVKIRYSYSPPQKSWDDECAFHEKISPRLIAQGIAGEFCLAHGLFAEAAVWDKRYRESLRAAHVVRRTLSVRARRWV